MKLLSRFRNRRRGKLRTASSADLAHLAEFVRTRSGVEGYVEPRTAVTETTLVLVAGTGEWTRRRVAGPSGAASFAKKHSIPLYEANVVGYPKRMRQWSQQRKTEN